MRLSKGYPPERMEAAAARALAFHLHSYRSIKSILERGLDRVVVQQGEVVGQVLTHPNVRGAAYCARQGGRLSTVPFLGLRASTRTESAP